MKVLGGFMLAIVVLSFAGSVIIFTGAYNIAATETHSRIVSWILDTARRRAIEVRGSGIQAPEHFTDDQVRAGFKEFDEMCIVCHGAPGKEPNEAAAGLLPKPPDLAKIAKRWDRSHLFWIVKNGIKLTGMPAFGPTHDDDEIWGIVAFVERLPTMTADQYSQMKGPPETPHTHSH